MEAGVRTMRCLRCALSGTLAPHTTSSFQLKNFQLKKGMRTMRCLRCALSGTLAPHTTATLVPMAIITLVWYTTFSLLSWLSNVTSWLYPNCSTHLHGAHVCRFNHACRY